MKYKIISFLGLTLSFCFLTLSSTPPQDEEVVAGRNLISSENLQHIQNITDVVFGPAYLDVDAQHFELGDRLSIFRSFLNSAHGHLYDVENRDSLLNQYRIIYGGLRSIGIEPKEIQEIRENVGAPYLAHFVESFKELADDDLRNLCNTISHIYNDGDYTGLESCQDWELLAEALRNLDANQRRSLSDLLVLLPATFDFGPVDAVNALKSGQWLENINRLENFENVGNLAEQAFQIYTAQDMQLSALDIIIRRLIDNRPHDEIMNEVRALKPIIFYSLKIIPMPSLTGGAV